MYRIKGINNDVETCECCGKTGLKRVVWLVSVTQDGEESEATPYGTTCAAKRLGVKGTKSQVENKIDELLIKAISEKINEIRKDFTAFNLTLLPNDLRIQVAKDEISLNEAIEIRNNRFPILNYLNGKITAKEAARYL